MTRSISFTLNGERVHAEVEPHLNLVELLRERFELFGARESCGQGLCGCCTVIVDGRAVSGCLYLASFVDGTDVRTIEGLATNGTLHPVQAAFVQEGAFQCGFCTPGFVLMTTQLLAQNPTPTEDEIRHYLSGNLCRCAAYPAIVEAVKSAARAETLGGAAMGWPNGPAPCSSPSSISKSTCAIFAGARFEPLNAQVLFALRALAQRVNDHATEVLSPLGLTARQYNYLAVIYVEGRVTPNEISRLIHTANASVTSMLNSLERDGLITRTEHPDDKRSFVVELTPAGKALYDQAFKVNHAHTGQMMARLSAAERKQLHRAVSSSSAKR